MSTTRKLAYLAVAEAFQWLPASAVRKLQLAKLQRMLAFAEARVPLYRETFHHAGVRASDLRTLADLSHFPTVTRKQIVSAYPDGVRYRQPRPEDVVFRTSGSSGQFMEIAYSAAGNDYMDAVYARALFQTGYRPWHSLAYFWGEARRRARAYERLGLMKKSYIRLVPDAEAQFQQLLEIAPDWIYVFPSAMLLLANVAAARGTAVLRPKGVICHGELLPPDTRKRIADTFGCQVFNLYGAQEFNRMAWDCAVHGAMHIDADSVHVEVLDGARVVEPGQEGELVVTGLVNRLMPLVRYRIGDAGRLVPGPCACGRGLPRLELTEGRMDDVLVFEGGRRVGPRTLAPRIETVPGFSQYRVVQKNSTHLEVQVVWLRPESPADRENLRAVVQQVVGSSVRVDVVSVPGIALNRRGKLRKILREQDSEGGK
jgi:phenylacetate-CoA ligase